jgi:hypothetical protein
LWVIGGDTVLGAVPTDVWRSADGRTWERVAATSPWAYLSILGVFNGALHIMGGTTDASQHRSSSDGATWTDLPALPFSRSSVTQAVVAFGRMFVIGGVDGDGVTQKNDTWKYDGSTWTQQSAAAVWSAREWIATAAYDAKLWVLTGKNGVANAGGLYNSDDGGVTWTSLPVYPYPPSHADGITVTDDGIALASGAGLPGSTYLISRLPADPSVTMATIAWSLWTDGAQYNPITNQVFGKASAGTSGSKTMGATGGPTSGLINGRPTIILDGTNDVLRYTDGAEVADIIGAAAWCVSFVGKINSSTADSGTPWVNPGLGCDSPGYWSAAGIRSSNPLTAYQDDGAVKTAAKTWTAGALVLVQVRFNGTQLQIRTGKGAWTTTAAGNIASLSGAFHIGANFNLLQFAGLELCEYAATNIAPSDATLDLVADDMIAKWGVAA